MAYVAVPKDMTKVKSRIVAGLTLRQIICFTSAAAIGLPVYLIINANASGNVAMIIMMVIMMPFFFVAMYEKDGMPAEKILLKMLRLWFFYPRARPYKTQNIYKLLEMEGKQFANEQKASIKATKQKTKA